MKKVCVLAEQGDSYRLEQALLIYRSKMGSPYVTVHDIIANSIGAGRPATIPLLRDLASAISKATATGGWVDARTLFVAPQLLVWHRPAARATLFFKGGGNKNKPHLAGPAPQPSLVFAVTHKSWYVWAVKGDARPDAKTRLCRAPYFNVYAGGEICTGNVVLPDRLGADTAAGFERAFFDSRFTHANQDRLTKTDTLAMWATFIESGVDCSFPQHVLIETKATLGHVIDQLTKGEHLDRDD